MSFDGSLRAKVVQRLEGQRRRQSSVAPPCWAAVSDLLTWLSFLLDWIQEATAAPTSAPIDVPTTGMAEPTALEKRTEAKAMPAPTAPPAAAPSAPANTRVARSRSATLF